MQGEPIIIFIGHLGEVHYVSTIQQSTVILMSCLSNDKSCLSNTYVTKTQPVKTSMTENKTDPGKQMTQTRLSTKKPIKGGVIITLTIAEKIGENQMQMPKRIILFT